MTDDFKPEQFLLEISALEKKKKKRTLTIITIVVIVSLLYIFISVFYLKRSSEVANISQKNTDSVQKVNDMLLKHISREDSAKKVILSYFKYQNNGDTMGVYGLLADTVLRYYLVDKPVAKTKLKTLKGFEINTNGVYYPDTSFTVSNINDTLYVLLKTPGVENNQTSYLLHEMKLNSSYQILYIRAYELNSERVKNRFGIQ